MEYRICNSKDIPNNFFKAIPISNIHVVIGRVNERLFAFDNSCPHRGASLSKGELNGSRVVCYMHGYEYDVFSGKLEYIPPKWTDQSPEWIKSKDLKLFPVLEKEGSIYVEM